MQGCPHFWGDVVLTAQNCAMNIQSFNQERRQNMKRVTPIRRRPRLFTGRRRPRTFNQLLAFIIADSKKDYYFRIRNRNKADETVLKFVYSPLVHKDRRAYSACKPTYKRYCETCRQGNMKPLSSWKFKKQMQLLGFVYQKHHRFYGNVVTTAYKNIGLLPKIKKE